MRSTSCGLTAPTISCSPTSTWSPSSTSSRARLETVYAISSEPSSGVTTILRACSSSSMRIRPATSEIGATPLGVRASNSSTHAGQAVGDVLTRDTTGVEGAHRQLGAGLADRLGGDDADRLADVDDLAGGQRAAVAGRAGADLATRRSARSGP